MKGFTAGRDALIRWDARSRSTEAYHPGFARVHDRIRNTRRSWSLPFSYQVARRRFLTVDVRISMFHSALDAMTLPYDEFVRRFYPVTLR
jgi:hypothetical protein